jgi:hypothetical protein
MTKYERRLAKAVTARLHEYEDYLAGKISTMHMNCHVCFLADGCDTCPFSKDQSNCRYGCLTEARQDFADQFGYAMFEEYDYSPKKIVRARYKELLRFMKTNGWEYS